MADAQQIDIPGVGIVEFPSSMSDGDIATAAKRLHDQATPKPPVAQSGVGIATAAVPLAGRLVQEAATNPAVPKIGSILGQLAGGVEGAMKGGPLGAAGGAWAGGKAGWFTGRLAQRLAAPVASAYDAVSPYLHALAPLGAAQGVNDLAQMAEPHRRDIGVFGVAADQNPDPIDPAHPPLLNDLATKVRTYIMQRLGGQ